MSADRPDMHTPEERRAREALQGLDAPRADAAFRERLKRDFTTGRIGARRVLVLPVPWRRRVDWRLALVPAALALLVVTVWAVDRGAGWTVMAVRGEGAAVVNGIHVPLADGAALARRLRPGVRLETPAGVEIELASRSGMVMQVTAGSALTLPSTPGRWMNRQVAGTVSQGEIRLTTGRRFAGARLRIATPEAEVEVTGTTLAVICEPVGTCVCVHDGTVMVGARGAGMERVHAGRRRFVFNDGRSPESAEIRPNEIGALGEFRDSRGAWMEGGR